MNTATTLLSVAKMLRDDAQTPIDLYELDDAIWLLLSPDVTVPTASQWPSCVQTFVAQRWVEGELANGGLTQALLNVGPWFALAAAAYRRLDFAKTAAMLDDAAELLRTCAAQGRTLSWDTIDALNAHDEAQLQQLEDRFEDLPEDDWNVSDQRIAQLRAQREHWLNALCA